jgi:hypothetical protein
MGEKRIMKRTLELPHPLSKFAARGVVNEGLCADMLLAFVHDWMLEPENSTRHRAAEWFLFESEQEFFQTCSEAEVDAETFRKHLHKCRTSELTAYGMRVLLSEY